MNRPAASLMAAQFTMKKNWIKLDNGMDGCQRWQCVKCQSVIALNKREKYPLNKCQCKTG